jgi:uncharacterized protein DUF5946
MPSPAAEPTEVCPGCGAVLVPVGEAAPRPGATASCARLFEVTLHGLREQVFTDPAAAAAVRSADAAYDAQHAEPGDPDRLSAALAVLGAAPGSAHPPTAWRTTIAAVAADLDVIDLGVLVEAWADAVAQDWTAVSSARQ